MSTPSISVVMPVYNGERFLTQALDSILNQTYQDFEFIIVDDASTDHTHEILAHYMDADHRIRVYHQAENTGVTAALNTGCQMAQGTFIARMDADDISLPQRFEKQYSFLLKNPQIGVLGTQTQHIDENGHAEKIVFYPMLPGLVMWSMLFFSSLAHPSVMMRRELIEKLGFYNPNRRQSQDYDLWMRASRITRLANLPDILLLYRFWKGSVTSSLRQKQEQASVEIVQNRLLELINTHVPVQAISVLQGLASEHYPCTLPEINTTTALIKQLRQVYIRIFSNSYVDINAINLDVGVKLLLLAVLAVKHSPGYAVSLTVEALRINPLSLVNFASKVAQKMQRKIQP